MEATSRVIFWVIVLLALAAVWVACGNADDAGPTVEAPATSPPSVEVSLFERLLGAIPDTPDTRQSVMIIDYAAVREILQLSPSSPDAKFPALLEYAIQSVGQSSNGIKIHMGTGPFISGMDDRAFQNTKREYLAFDGRDVDQSVEAGMAPSIFEVVWGRFDPAATARALASCAECPPPDIEIHNDVQFYSWGEDFQGNLRERRNPPAFDHLGRGGRIAVTSEYVYRTVETPGMKALIDSRSGDGQTLADVEEFRLLAQAMSGLGAYTAFFSSRTYKVSVIPDESSGLNAFLANNFPEVIDSMQAVYKKLVAEIGKSTLLLPYQAFSTGAGVDDDGPYMALALVHSDAESAEENGRRLRIRIEDALNYPELDDWRDGLEEYSFLVDGRILSATMRGDGPASMWRSLAFLWIPTPLIPHE